MSVLQLTEKVNLIMYHNKIFSELSRFEFSYRKSRNMDLIRFAPVKKYCALQVTDFTCFFLSSGELYFDYKK